MLFLRIMGMVEGDAEGCHCDNASFISMLVCYLFFQFFFLLLLLFVCSFSSYSPFMERTSIWMEYHITLLVYVCICPCRSIIRSFLHWYLVKRNFKGHSHRPTPLSYIIYMTVSVNNIALQ